jgi:hypothetical protein
VTRLLAALGAVLAGLGLHAACAGRGALSRAAGGAATRPTVATERIGYGRPRVLAYLANREIDESSGMACSRRRAGVFWTHNDSGGGPRLYAFDTKGRDLATYTVLGAAARDWEDMASCMLDGKPHLVVGDAGDNATKRSFAAIHLIPEPAPDPNQRGIKGTVRVARTIRYTYDDGPQDCEAIGVDPTTKRIYLVSKRGKRTFYELPIPAKQDGRRLVARSIARLGIGQATAMDVSPDGRRVVVLTYLDAYEYARAAGEKWPAALARKPRRIPMPFRRQGESVCYGPDGRALYLTSEKRPTPLFMVSAETEPPARQRRAPAAPARQ